MPINDDTLMVRGKSTSLTTLPTDEYQKMKEKAAKWDRVLAFIDDCTGCRFETGNGFCALDRCLFIVIRDVIY